MVFHISTLFLLDFSMQRATRWLSGKKNPPAEAGDRRDMVSIPGSGRSPGVGNDYLLQYSCLENYMDRGAW